MGSGNSAGQAALHFARYAREVTLLVRQATLADSMSQYLIDALASAGVTVRYRSSVIGGSGSGRLERLVVRDLDSGTEAHEPTDGVFVLIGAQPRTQWLPDSVHRDEWGFVLTGSDVLDDGRERERPEEGAPLALETSMRGVFAVGDVRRGSVKRVASAVGEGSVVVSSVHQRVAEVAEHDRRTA